MKLQVLSDLHIEFHVRPPALPGPDLDVPDVGADVLVLAGDIGAGDQGVRWAAGQADRLGIPCLYVAGNHEYYGGETGQRKARMRRAADGTAVRFLDNDEAILDGVRFLGCTFWTDMSAYNEPKWDGPPPETMLEQSMADYQLIHLAGPAGRRRLLRATDTARWNRTSVRWLEQRLAEPFDGATVVITHHGPSLACQHPRFAPDWVANGFYSWHDRLMERVSDRVEAWIFGHTHASMDAPVNGIRLVSNQKGYPGETVPGGFDPAKLFEVNAS